MDKQFFRYLAEGIVVVLGLLAIGLFGLSLADKAGCTEFAKISGYPNHEYHTLTGCYVETSAGMVNTNLLRVQKYQR